MGTITPMTASGTAAAAQVPFSRPTASESVGAEHVEALDGERLGGVLYGHDERLDALAPAREPDCERAADWLDLAVERQLADDRVRSNDPVLHDARGGEDAEGDRQVERRALLPDV